MKRDYPKVVTPFNAHGMESAVFAVERMLRYTFSPAVFSDYAAFAAALPAVCWTPLKTPPFTFAFFLCAPFRQGTYRFFYEMISQWLIPGKKLNVSLQMAVDFVLPQLGDHRYISGEVVLEVCTKKERALIERNLPIIEREILLGIRSSYHAARILETKGVSQNEKVTRIQERLTDLIARYPHVFDFDLLSRMQLFLVHGSDRFKEGRSDRHLTKIIVAHYLFEKTLMHLCASSSRRRTIILKMIRTKRALGLVINLSFLRESEMLTERHLLRAIHAVIGKVSLVEGTFISERREALYIEVEREEKISLSEERKLRESLPHELRNSIETRLNPIFTSLNEEEILRDIVTLSRQLRFVRDHPQVIINFNKQSEERLEFLVIALSLKPLAVFLEQKATFLKCRIDRVKRVGSLRKKYAKIATVFRLSILKAPFLRQDESIDLNKARQEIVRELSRIIGPFRDYNGGILSKEGELFGKLRELLQEIGQENSFILEEFFYSLTPAVMRSLLPAEVLQKLFLLTLKIELEGSYSILIDEAEDFYAVITASAPSFKKEIITLVDSLDAATTLLESTPHPTLALVWRGPSKEQSLELRLALEQTMESWADQNRFPLFPINQQ